MKLTSHKYALKCMGAFSQSIYHICEENFTSFITKYIFSFAM